MSEPISEVQPTPLKQQSIEQSPLSPPEHSGMASSEVAEKPQEAMLFDTMRHTIDNLVFQIRERKNAEESKKALTNLLKAREIYYRDIAMAINPDIHPVEGRENVYRVGSAEIFGSITAMLDATPALETHKDLVRQLGLQFGQDSQSVMGETPPPRALAESTMVYVGSGAQDRIQPFASDIDADEFVRISAPDIATAANTLSHAIQRSTRRPAIIKGPGGSDITLHLTDVVLGKIKDGKTDIALSWSPSEIHQGFKIVKTNRGEQRISLEDACSNPRGFSVEYIGMANDTVFGVNKKVAVLANTEHGDTLIDTVGAHTKPTQQVFFDDPTKFHLLDKMHDADTYIAYISEMKNDIKTKYNKKNVSKIKVMKRLYNLYKAQGDLTGAQDISGFFSSPTAAIYQLESRYRLGRKAVAKGIMTSEQRQAIKENLLNILNTNNSPLAHEAVTLLSSPHIHSVYNRFQDVINELINSDVETFLEDKPSIRESLNEILQDNKKTKE